MKGIININFDFCLNSAKHALKLKGTSESNILTSYNAVKKKQGLFYTQIFYRIFGI